MSVAVLSSGAEAVEAVGVVVDLVEDAPAREAGLRGGVGRD